MNLVATRWQDTGKNCRQTCKTREPSEPYLQGGRGRQGAQGENWRPRLYFSAIYFSSTSGDEVSGDGI